MVDGLVRSGRYQNASEVLREGLRMIEARQLEEAARLEALRGAARVGLDGLERGDFREFGGVEAMVGHLEGVADAVIGESGAKV